ncbi:hypothetical protein ACIBVL_23490 [Streptomyces sp. NPDC049687]|uniref:hypothetical protein n=1 Tax=Streptomyces sp. NPDC049687 TaxID=3365596 RepID=UPI0037969430
MTQSGQGEEPSARPAHEGIVLPSDGGEPLLPGMTSSGSRPAPQQPAPHPGQQPGPYGAQSYGQQAPTGGQTWGQPWGPDQQPAAPQPEQGWPLPADQQSQQWGTQQPDAWGAGPLPPEGTPAPASPPSYGQSAPAPASPPSYGQGAAGVPLPPVVDEGATQYIPPVPAGPVDDGRTQYLPPVPASGPAPGGDEGATQYIPPVRPGALPPEAPAESTHFLGTGAQNNPGPMPGASPPDAEATQYIPPVPAQDYGAPGGDRQPPAEFENLFRSGPGGESPAGATQHLPRFSEPETPGYGGAPQGYGAGPAGRAPQPSYAAPQSPYAPPARDDDHGAGGRGGRRTGSRVPLFAAIGVAIALVGIGAGALLGGGGDDDQGGGNKTVAASAPATEPSASSDAAKQQAVALDKLLADSGSSRASVIAAVANVKACTNLPQAAADLRNAAGQRTELVTELSGLAVDKLPDHAALTSALTKAWQASAAADNHYAAWADEVAGDKKKACKRGTARATSSTQQGNRESGTASSQKNQAARLWNAIAKEYGLTQRQPTQL